MRNIWVRRFTEIRLARCQLYEVIKEKDNRGLFDSDPIVVAEQTAFHTAESPKSRSVSVPGRKWLDVCVLIFVLRLFFVTVLPAFGQSTFGSVRGVAQDASGA